MPPLPPAPRTRLVNFRVTAAEYESLRQAALESGYRSLSEFARDAVCSLESPSSASSLEDRVLALESRIDYLAANLARLAANLDESVQPARTQPAGPASPDRS